MTLDPRRHQRHVARGMSLMSKMEYSELNVRDLRILSALLRERSITRTALSMGMAQPAVSKVLAHLRVQFSDPLFVRNGQAMQPTAKALDISGQLHALLGAVDGLRAVSMAFDPL